MLWLPAVFPPLPESKTNRQELPSREADTPNCVPLQPLIFTVNKLISFLPNLMLHHPTASAKEPQTDSHVPQIMISLISRIPNNLVLKTWFQRVSHFVFLLQQFKRCKLPCPVTQPEAAVAYSFPPFDSEVAARTVHCTLCSRQLPISMHSGRCCTRQCFLDTGLSFLANLCAVRKKGSRCKVAKENACVSFSHSSMCPVGQEI